MLRTLSTLISGASARSEDRVRDAFALELIDQKIREAESSLRAAKATLASLIQRQRSEKRQADGLDARIVDLMERAKSALADGKDALAEEAAQAIAQMENERAIRTQTLDRLDEKVVRLKSSIEAGHRRIVDLRQGAIQARAVRREQEVQMRMVRTTGGGPTASVEEAEELIARVVGRDDPFEQSEILSEINADLDSTSLVDRMADAGIGPATRSTTNDVLERLKAQK